MERYKELREIAKIIRSKNSGPFEMTMDVIFKDASGYRKILEMDVINKEVISKLYQVPVEKIITLEQFDAANAIKITIPRPRPQGSYGETDMHCAQQHVPLMHIKVKWSE